MRGMVIDTQGLAQDLALPVFTSIAVKRDGVEELLAALKPDQTVGYPAPMAWQTPPLNPSTAAFKRSSANIYSNPPAHRPGKIASIPMFAPHLGPGHIVGYFIGRLSGGICLG